MGMKLFVEKASVLNRSLTEAQREARVMKLIRALGVWDRKMAHRWLKGVPDRYLAGGNWIEFKQVEVSLRRPFALLRGVTADQHSFLTDAHAGGDRTYICVFVVNDENRAKMILLPYWYASTRHMWSKEMVNKWGVDYRSVEMVDYLDRVFGSEYARNSSELFYQNPVIGLDRGRLA